MQDKIQQSIFTIWDYDNQTVTRYQRQGDCSICGVCCQRKIVFSVARPTNPDNMRQGGQATTGRGVWVEFQHDRERVFFQIRACLPEKVQCCYLGENKHCQNYPDRSILCRAWPFTPSDIATIPECSYEFLKLGIWSFKEVGK